MAKHRSFYGLPDRLEWAEVCRASAAGEAAWARGVDLVGEYS